MIIFNELRVSETDNKLIIDASVSTLTYYSNVYIDKISIDTQDNYVGTGPSSTPIYQQTVEGNIKDIRLELDEAILNNSSINTTLFFVYISIKGTPSPEAPCGADKINSLAVVANLSPIYKQAISLLNSVNENDILNRRLIDFILHLNGLDIALKTCSYLTAIKYWKRYFQIPSQTITPNFCSCNE